MATQRITLTTTNVRELPDGRYLDTGKGAPTGFYLLVRKLGRSRIYTRRYTIAGVTRECSLGRVSRMTYGEAKQKAREWDVLIGRQIDPNPPQVAADDAAEDAPKPIVTVWQDCMAWYNHEAGAWSEQERYNKKRSLAYDIGNPDPRDDNGKPLPITRPPVCGHLETTTLTPASLTALFYRKLVDGSHDRTSPWFTHNETCQRTISILRRAIDHAILNDDAGRWKDRVNPVLGLSSRLPKGARPDAVARRAVPYDMAQAYYARLETLAAEGASETERMSALFLLTMIETYAPRHAEVLNMTWGELTHHRLWSDIWVIPAGRRGRMKNKRNDRVVRDIPMLAITLARLNAHRSADAKPEDYVFRGAALGGKRLGHQQPGKLMHRLATEFGIDATPHGWRTACKTWAKDHRAHLNDLVAVEIAHDRVTETAAGDRYNDTTLLAHRRILGERFVAFLRGEPYRGPAAPRGLELVVDNAAPVAAA